MRSAVAIILAITIFLTSLAFPAAVASQASQGHVSYQVSVTGPSGNKSLIVQESVSPSISTGKSLLTIGLIGDMQNLTYSRLVNSSDALLFPYMILPSTNQSLTYQSSNYSITLSANLVGTSSVTFNGSSYKLSDYVFNAALTIGTGNTNRVSGSIEAFPSSLIYSARADLNGTTVQLKLLATNLPLDPQATGSTSQAEAIAMSSVGAAALAIVALIGFKRYRRKSASAQPNSKPSYWVD
jgi:hypothetical protein